MIVGVLKEPQEESRVSLLPELVAQLTKKGHKVLIEQGAGVRAFASDADYEKAGASIGSAEQVIAQCDVIFSIHLPNSGYQIPSSKILIGVYQPLYNRDLMLQWANAGIICFSLDMLPRTTRAQSMDVLSSQANIAGYKAVLLAALTYPRYFPLFMTAAGSIAPAKVLVLGAGVAGLQAIATARRLGAVVEVFDTRPAVKEEVKSLGAKFIEVEGAADPSQAGGYAVEQSEAFKEKQEQKIAESFAKADIVITTAQIPGKSAPVLVTDSMLDTMRSGSVIVDLAAATGGNTSKTVNNSTISYRGVTIIGNSGLASSLPSDASKLYGKNVQQFIGLITGKNAALSINREDDLVKGCCITEGGKLVHEKLLTH